MPVQIQRVAAKIEVAVRRQGEVGGKREVCRQGQNIAPGEGRDRRAVVENPGAVRPHGIGEQFVKRGNFHYGNGVSAPLHLPREGLEKGGSEKRHRRHGQCRGKQRRA